MSDKITDSPVFQAISKALRDAHGFPAESDDAEVDRMRALIDKLDQVERRQEFHDDDGA